MPKISLWGRLTVKTRYVIPPLFLIVAASAFFFSNRCPYVFGYSTLDTVKQNESKIADKMVASTFGTDKMCIRDSRQAPGNSMEATGDALNAALAI